MNNTIVRRVADICFLGCYKCNPNQGVVFSIDCPEQINVKHTISKLEKRLTVEYKGLNLKPVVAYFRDR
jgi:hypothetical protein